MFDKLSTEDLIEEHWDLNMKIDELNTVCPDALSVLAMKRRRVAVKNELARRATSNDSQALAYAAKRAWPEALVA